MCILWGVIKTTEARLPRRYISVIIALAALAFLMLVATEARAAFKVAVVRSDTVNVRSGPGTANSKIGMVNKGDRLFVIKESGDWRQVILSSGKTGWIYRPYLAVLNKGPVFPVKPGSRPKPPPASGQTNPPAQPPPAETGGGQSALVTGDKVNVRSGPGISYQIVAVAAKATRITAFSQSNGWYSVQLPDGTRGWMSATYVDTRPDVSRGGEQNPTPPTGEQPGTDQPGTDQPQNPAPTVPPQAPKLLKIEAVRMETGGEALVLTGEKALSYTLSKLKNPDRLVIDIANAEIGDLVDIVPDNLDYISQARVAQNSLEPKVVRVVVDLKKVPVYKAGLSKDNLTLTVSLSEPTIEGKTIVLDPGHGGYDPGAVGVTGLQEKGVNLDIALRVQKLLTDMGANVIMTRSDDTFIALSERAAIANNANADAFVAIHANSSTSASLGGTSTYYYAPSSNTALYSQLGQRSNLASKVQGQLIQNLGIRNIGTLQANFAVLRETKMPSILVETAFLSNKDEEALLKDDAFRDKTAQAIAQGLVDYFTNPV